MVVVDRSIGEIHALTYATVVAVDGRGPRLGGPDYPTPTYANTLRIDRVTPYDRLVGRDGDGAYHLLRSSPRDDRVLEVRSEPGADPEHEQAIADKSVLTLWIEHVDEQRGWDAVVGEFEQLVTGGDSA
ncbi:hypothetical protein EI982_14710 [Haloplanus rallus]|uniref:Uncharacterized protein n=1 Tax=Haloplanus rallus TaxID=1816183 RepID=A0A6B9FB95_9EURY|nr:hypothetical protein [Haloplanus rallus]QGX95944.1 hypothetical protein EI982_14710 [Haloplanus rallus]